MVVFFVLIWNKNSAVVVARWLDVDNEVQQHQQQQQQMMMDYCHFFDNKLGHSHVTFLYLKVVVTSTSATAKDGVTG